MKINFKKMLKLTGAILVSALYFVACAGSPAEEDNAFAGKTFYHQEDVSSFGVADIKEITVGQISFKTDGKGNISEYGIDGVEGDSFDFTYSVNNDVATLTVDGKSFSTSQIKDGTFTLNGLKYTSKKLATYEDLEKKLNGKDTDTNEVKFPKVDFSKIYVWNGTTAGNTFDASTGVLALSGQWSGASGSLFCDASDYNYLKIEYEQLSGSVQFFVVYNDENVETNNQSKSIVSLKASETAGYIELNAAKKNSIANYHLMADTNEAVSIKIKNIEFVKTADSKSETKEENKDDKDPVISTASESKLTSVSEMTFGSNGNGTYKEYLTTGDGETKNFTYVVFDGSVTITMEGNNLTSTKLADGKFILHVTMGSYDREFSLTKYRTLTEAWNEYQSGTTAGETKTFSITLNGNGADDFTTDTFTIDTTSLYGSYTFTTNPTKEGYTFVGWKNPNQLYPVKYYFAGETDNMVTGNTTYNATFFKNEITVTFKANTSKGGYGNDVKISLKLDKTTLLYEKLTFPECNFGNDNGTFLGWNYLSYASKEYFEDYSYQPGDSTIEYSDCTYFAIWKPAYYWVTFDANGNGQTYLKKIQNTAGYKEDLVVNNLFKNKLDENKIKYKYYRFLGWGDKNNSTTVYGENDDFTLSGPKTFYAIWELGYILNEKSDITIESLGKKDTPFTLLKSESVDIIFQASGDLDVMIINSNGKTVYSKTGTKFDVSTTLSAGDYTLRVYNGNWIKSKTYKIAVGNL